MLNKIKEVVLLVFNLAHITSEFLVLLLSQIWLNQYTTGVYYTYLVKSS